MTSANVTYPTLSDEDLLEMEKRFTRMDNPRLIVEVRELQRDVRVLRGVAELSAQECLNLRRQLAEAKDENRKLKSDFRAMFDENQT